MPFFEGRFFRQTETLEARALESLASTHLSNFIEMTLINSWNKNIQVANKHHLR